MGGGLLEDAMWNITDTWFVNWLHGALPGNGETARNMAALMSEAFIALARTGTPHHAALPDWSRYTLPNRETMIFDWPPRMENDPRGAERELFASVPYVQPGT